MIRADVHLGPDGRPKGSGIVAFESPDDARNAIAQFNGYDWQGRMLEVREDRFAGPPGAGFGGARGGFGGGFGGRGAGYAGRGGFGGGRGGFGGQGMGGGYGGRGGFGGGGFGGHAGGGYDAPVAAPAASNPFTDFATSGGERSEMIYVRNVCLLQPNEVRNMLICIATLVYQQRGSCRTVHYNRKGRTCRDPVRDQRTLPRHWCCPI